MNVGTFKLQDLWGLGTPLYICNLAVRTPRWKLTLGWNGRF